MLSLLLLRLFASAGAQQDQRARTDPTEGMSSLFVITRRLPLVSLFFSLLNACFEDSHREGENVVKYASPE